MSKSTKKKSSELSENLVSDFINNKSNEPVPKKTKKTAEEPPENDPNDSFKFFKNFKPRSTKHKLPEPSTSSSNVATSFLNKPANKMQATTPKKRTKANLSKGTKRKPRNQSDIRKVISKQEQLFNHIVSESCLQEGIDPEEMQLALAISESLKDQTKQLQPEASASSSPKFENPFTAMGKVQPISAVLERFGFKCKKSYSEYELDMITNSKLCKRSKFQKFPTLLTRTSNEKRNEIIKAKIDEVLSQNQSQASIDFCDDSCHEYRVFSFHLQELQESLQTVFMISRESRSTDEVLLNFYVTELFEPSFVKADHLLKDWSKIPGREPTPERTLQPGEVIAATERQEEENPDEVIEPELEIEGANDEPENDSKISCLDIFADLEDFEFESSVAEKSVNDNSGGLAAHLDSLHERFSQSITTVELEADVKSSERDATIEDTDYSIKPVKEVEQVDLTQQDSSLDSNYTIPFDDSYYSLQQHMKKLREAEGNSSVAQPVETSISKQLSLLHVDLVSSDDETNATLQPNEYAENNEDGANDDEVMLSQNSLEDDELIEISDEEVNYSLRKYHNNNESPDASSQSPVKKGESVDLTQEESKQDLAGTQLEVVSYADQSLVDLMDQQDEFSINDTICNLLETSKPQNLDRSTRDRSTKFMDGDGLSESIRDIMRRYGGTSETPRSFRKMHSDSHLVNESVKRRRTVLFSIGEEKAVVDLTQQFEDESMKENSFQLNDFNSSINQSLENIANYSPIAPRKKTQGREKPKVKKSLGVQLDNDYIVDTESVIPEPDYKNMTPVELKQALFKYGIRPLPVKKAVKLLEFIYDQLHPTIRVAADEEIDVNDSRRDLNITDIVTNINIQQDDDFVFELGLVDDEEYVLPKVRKSKNPTCAIPLHISFYNMARSNEKIQKFILEFRPIELDHVHKHFRKFGLTYQLNDIIAFLDKRCITFKTKEQSLSKTHERKKQKRAQKSQKASSQKT